MSNDYTSGQSNNNCSANSTYDDIPVTGEVTLTYISMSNAAYEFAGWGTGATPTDGNSSPITYNITTNTTYYAFFKRKQFAVTFAPKGTYGTSTVSAAISSTGLTSGNSYNYGSNVTFTATPATGYKIEGWYSDAGCTASLSNGTNTTYTVEPLTAAANVYVKFVPKQTTISFTNTGTGYSSGGQSSNMTATYGQTMPTTIGTPTAQTGWAFMGYYDAAVGGTKYYNANGTSARNWDKDQDGGTVTLYAHYEKSVITDFTFSPATAAGGATVTVTPVIPLTPEGTTYICWSLYSNASCTIEEESISFSANPSTSPAAVTFTAPTNSGVYYLKAVYRTGNDCSSSAGDVLNTHIEPYVVASDHTVTIKYMCGSAEIAPRGSVVVPAASTAEVTALSGNDVFGYTFSRWEIDEGSGISTSDELTDASIEISANYEGTIIAQYSEIPTVYFKNTLGWANVYVTYDAYWDNAAGDAASERNDGGTGTGNYNRVYHQMTRLGDTDIWYDVIPSKYLGGDNWSNWAYNIAFNNTQSGDISESNGNYKHFNGSSGKVIFRKDFDPAHTLFVPSPASIGGSYAKNGATYISCTETTTGYYDGGYWRTRSSTESGYSLRSELMFGNWTDHTHTFKAAQAGDSVYTLTLSLKSNYEYYIKVFRNVAKNIYSYQYRYDNDITITSAHTDLRLKGKDGNDKFVAATAGEYTFSLLLKKNGTMELSVKYPMYAGDYEVMYYDSEQDKWHPAGTIDKDATENITSFFVRKNQSPQIKWRKSTGIANNGTITWGSFTNVDLSTYTGSGKVLDSSSDEHGVYNFHFNIANNTLSLTNITPYTGNYYIRTDNAGTTGWSDYKSADHLMVYSDFSESAANKYGEKYSHYYMHWCPRGTNIKFVIANDYSPCISDTLAQDVGNPYDNTDTGGTLKTDGNNDHSGSNAHLDQYSANVRFMWNRKTNKVSRAYISGATDVSKRFLVLQGEDGKFYNSNGVAFSVSGLDANSTILDDKNNWTYDVSVKVKPGGKIKLYARYNDHDQYLIGTEDVGSELISGTGDATYPIRVIYDFKSNRLISAYQPSTDALTGNVTLNADMMIIRDHQGAARNLSLGTYHMETEKTVYGVMRFSKFVLNNRDEAGDVLPANEQLPQRQRNHYYISFPFDVNVSDIFGFGTYGTHWVIQYYDGAARAKKGLWADPGMTYWKYMAPTGKLNANEGYLLALSPSNMAFDKTGAGEVWANNKTEVELYFPAASAGANIYKDNIDVDGLSTDYESTINRGDGTEGDRRVKDSYWRCIGVPSFADYNETLKRDNTNPLSWATGWAVNTVAPITDDIHYLYEINWTDYTLKPVSGSTFEFEAMHAYIIQSKSGIRWENASAYHNSIVARRRSAAETENIEFRLALSQNDTEKDQTFIRLSDDEEVTAGFEFGQDMSKEIYSANTHIYTLIGSERAAGNSLPMSEQKTVVPVGVKIATEGEYTFAIPEGTEGVGVVMVDKVTGTRTNLGLTDYTVWLEAGTCDARFEIEISPVEQVPTNLTPTLSSGEGEKVRKVLIDGVLYIIRDGKVYDATGRMKSEK